MEKRKTETMAAKQHKSRREIGLFSKKDDENDTKNDTDPDQADNKYLLQF